MAAPSTSRRHLVWLAESFLQGILVRMSFSRLQYLPENLFMNIALLCYLALVVTFISVPNLDSRPTPYGQ